MNTKLLLTIKGSGCKCPYSLKARLNTIEIGQSEKYLKILLSNKNCKKTITVLSYNRDELI
tara:strand:+ start:197 stop:379 length:183 start_codon:yes stop_codon:yes gene_type:complete